jgi:hypothetical protein
LHTGIRRVEFTGRWKEQEERGRKRWRNRKKEMEGTERREFDGAVPYIYRRSLGGVSRET